MSNTKTTNTAPVYRIYSVSKNGGDKATWQEIGAAWRHKDGKGLGLLTFQIPYAFRTPAGFCLQIRGPANCPKDGIYPLEGIVDAEFRAMSISMNWKVTRPNQAIVFKKNEPIGLLLPLRRHDMEAFEVSHLDPRSPDQERGCMEALTQQLTGGNERGGLL